MRHTLLRLALLWMPSLQGLHAQIDLDSLWRVWHDGSLPAVDRLRAMSYISIDGFLYTDPDSGYALARMQYDLAAKHGNERYLGVASTTMGEYHLMRGDYAAALERWTQAQAHFAAANEPVAQAKAFSNMGVLMQELGDTARALDLQRRSLDLATAIPDTGSMCAALINMGSVMLGIGDSTSAEFYFQRSLDLSPGTYNPRDEAIATSNLGLLYSARGRYAEAERLQYQALAVARDQEHTDIEAHALHCLGNHYLRLADLPRAEDNARQALELATRTLQTKQMAETADLLYEILKRRGRTGEALAMLERKLAIEKDLRAEEGRKEVLRSAYEKKVLADSLAHAAERATLESQRTIAELRAERARNRAWAAGGAGSLVLLGYGLWTWTDRRRRQERFEKEAATLEVQALRSQMNPHFIFNALNSINAYVQGNDPDAASTYLSKFAKVMRGVLENSRHNEVPLQDDLDTLRGYMELERMRMQGRFDFHIEMADDIDAENVLVPPLVAQPFVENAIWHGMAGREDKGHIRLRVERQGSQLVWTIEDNGPGRQARAQQQATAAPAQPTKKTSLGTAITRSRLDLVRKQYGGHTGFRYEDLDPGTRVVLEMPVIE